MDVNIIDDTKPTSKTMDDPGDENISTKNGRYSVESIQSKNFKQVPFEKLDYSIYKTTNTVAFATSEERMPLWIEALQARYRDGLHDNAKITTRWEENDNKEDAAKCEKVTIYLTSSKGTNTQNLLTITALINHGRIQIHGKSYKEWGDKEFPEILEIISSSPSEKNPTKDLESFIENILNPKQTPTTTNETYTSDITEQAKSTESLPTNDEPMLSNIKCSMASLEADFVLFQKTTQQNINNLLDKLSDKDDELNQLKNQIKTLKTTNIQQQQSISDLTLKQMQNQDEMKKIQNKQKILEKKNATLTQKLQTLNQEEKETTETTNQIEHETDVSTSNNYSTLIDNPDQSKNGTESETEIPTPQTQQTDKTKEFQPPSKNRNDGETIIICDSNGRHLIPDLLCPGSKTSYIRCPTLPEANKIIEETNFTNPKTFLLHCGTNDLESNHSDNEITELITTTTANIMKKYPKSRVIISTLLPRKDALHTRTENINRNLEKVLPNKNVNVVKHDNIEQASHLRDKKHLNTIGVKRFAQNLKRAYFGHPPKINTQQKKYTKQPMRYRWQPNQPNMGTTPLPPYYHMPPTNQIHPRRPYQNEPLYQHPPKDTTQTEGRMPQEMVQLIKLLHNRYVN